MSSREIIKLIKNDDWYLARINGSHHIFKHPEKKGTVTVPHPRKELKSGTIKSIKKQAGL